MGITAKKEKKPLDLTQGTIWKVLAAFIIPIILGSLIQQLYTTVDAIIVGKFLGKDGLAAIDSMHTMFKFPLNFLNGLTSGATILVSRYFGGKNEDNLDKAIHTAFTVALLLGIICSVAGAVFAPALLRVMSVPEDIFDMTLIYVRIFFAGLWTMSLYNMIAGVVRAFGDSRSPFYILIVCCVINIVGDLLLVGVFNTGVAGAAIATIGAQAVSAILILRVLAKKHNHCHGSVIALRFHGDLISALLKLGIPLALQSILFPVANSIIQAHVNTMGTDAIAAWAVCGKLDLIIWLIADSMAPALSTYVAQNVGAKKMDRVSKGVFIGAGASAVAVGFVSLILFIFAGPLGSLFLPREDAVSLIGLVIKFMRMMCPFYIFYSFAESFSGACCGTGGTVKPMITTLLCTCGLRVALIFIWLPLAKVMDTIVWIYIISWIVTGIAFTAMFLYRRVKLNAEAEKAKA